MGKGGVEWCRDSGRAVALRQWNGRYPVVIVCHRTSNQNIKISSVLPKKSGNRFSLSHGFCDVFGVISIPSFFASFLVSLITVLALNHRGVDILASISLVEQAIEAKTHSSSPIKANLHHPPKNHKQKVLSFTQDSFMKVFTLIVAILPTVASAWATFSIAQGLPIRRSVAKYTDDKVPEEAVTKAVEGKREMGQEVVIWLSVTRIAHFCVSSFRYPTKLL